MREDELAVRRPGVDSIAALFAALGDEGAVEDGKRESEAALELVLPLQDDGRRTGDDHSTDLLAKEELAENEPGFDRLADADVVGDEEVDAGEQERFAQRFELVGLDLDAGAVRGLKEAGIGRGDGAPALDVEVGRKAGGRVESTIVIGDGAEGRCADDGGVDLALPEDVEPLSLGVIVEAREPDERLIRRLRPCGDGFDEVPAGADADDLTREEPRVVGEGDVTGSDVPAAPGPPSIFVASASIRMGKRASGCVRPRARGSAELSRGGGI